MSTLLFVIWALLYMIELSPVTAPVEFAGVMVLSLAACAGSAVLAMYPYLNSSDG